MRKLVIFLFLIFSFHIAFSQNLNSDIVSEIKVENLGNVSLLTAKVLNKTDVYHNLKYVFSITSFDKNYKPLNESLEEFLSTQDASKKTLNDFLSSIEDNKYLSKDSAEDFFMLDPYQTKDLHKATIESGLDNRIIVLLLIYDEYNNLVGKSRIVFNNDEKEEEELSEEKIRDGLEITGIVLDQTKTKMGRDFYDKFYFYYDYNNVNGDQVVKIDEIFTFRRTTKIMVKVIDETIYEFFSRPNEEYIEQMAKLTVQRVYKYFENRKKQKSYISPY